MKHYLVILRNRHEAIVRAKYYEHTGNQYAFETDGSDDAQFFLADQVIGITVLRDDSAKGRLKYYLATLRDSEPVVVKAKGHKLDDKQYVFEGDDPNEVQFLLHDEVVGISLLRDDSRKAESSLVTIPL